MSILGQVKQSGSPIGARIVIAAAEKMGKTTMSIGAPKALLIPTEQGFAGVTANHTPMITDWTQMLSLQQEIAQACQAGKFQFQSVVIDSATALEVLIHAFTIGQDGASKNNKALTMESSHGGYGKAYKIADRHFQDFLAWCDWLAINFRINIIFTAHVFSSKVRDPLAGEYDSWDLRLHSPKDQKGYGKREILTQWADVVGYMHEPIIVSQTNGVMQGVSRGQGRVLGVERTPSYVAGNRYGLRGVIPLAAPPANSWNNFARALWDQTQGRIDLFNREFP